MFHSCIDIVVQDADCSSDACGDTTNYVCDPDAADKCKGNSFYLQNSVIATFELQ